MKKNLFLFLALFISLGVFAQKEHVVFFHNNDIAILLNGEKDVFEEAIIFQGDDLSKLDVKKLEKIGIKEHRFDGNKLILVANNKETYEFNPKGKNISEKSFGGYGLSKRKGRMVLERYQSDTNIFNLIHSETITYDKMLESVTNTKCHSGGEGATDCSLKSDTMECSVTCRDTYYACYDDTRKECICKSTVSGADQKATNNGTAIPMKSFS